MLEGRSITKAYGGRRILDCIDIMLRPSEIVALMGPSGSGKTTLLRALSLIEPPDSGNVSVDGIVIRTLPSGKLIPPIYFCGHI
jgi:ABC-type Fe3+/spermidine/putrescine transport system ATPase subunit